MNLKQFAKLMEDRATLLKFNCNELKKDVAETLLTVLAETTPVDKGTAISNWQIGLGSAVTNTLAPYAKGFRGSTWGNNVRATIAQGKMRIDTTLPNEAINVSNNLNYIDDLERGYSPQAPDGMTKNAIIMARLKLKGAQVLGKRYVRQY